MAISIKEVEYIAKLAKLRFNDDEKIRLADELGKILNYMEKLNEVDTKRVEPLSHPHEIVNAMREDKVKPSLTVAKALENAPDRKQNYFKVPKVIKK